MPDVKWYAGGAAGAITISTTTVTGGTDTRLLRQSAGEIENSLFADDGTTVNLTSGNLRLVSDVYLGRSAAGRLRVGNNAADATGEIIASALYATDVSNALLKNAGNLRLTSDGRIQLNGTGIETLQSLSIGQQSLDVASAYLFIQGVSGAGGTPTTTHLTAGSGVATYTQETHDGQATKYVIAYNLGGSLRYLSIPLDGTTATWTAGATRP